nr:MAG: hypothetical protein DIU64_08265 [Caldicoprobacter oshimai]
MPQRTRVYSTRLGGCRRQAVWNEIRIRGPAVCTEKHNGGLREVMPVMGIDAIKEIRQAEQQAEEIKKQAMEKAREILRRAEEEGNRFLVEVTQQAQQERQQFMRQAEEEARKEIEALNQKAEEECQKIRQMAQAKLDKAISLIMGKVVNMHGHS